MEYVEIQLAPRARAAFSLNVGLAPFAGIDGITIHIPAEDILVTWLDEFYVVYQCPRFRTGFSVWRWPWHEPTQSDYETLAKKVAGLIPEVELALREGRIGPHVRRIRI